MKFHATFTRMEDQVRQIAREEAERVFAAHAAAFNQQPEHITLKEVEQKYDLYGATLYRHINAGHLSLLKLGGKSFLKRSEVEKLFIKVK